MTTGNFFCYISISALLITSVNGVHPDAMEVGRILGYPGSELIVEDVTEKEREIYSIPTLSERSKGLKPPLDPKQLISAYRITGKDPSTFFPILVTVAEKGAFLSKEAQNIIDSVAALPDAPIAKGGKGHLGSFAMGGSSQGGLFMSKIRTPSQVKEMKYPSHHLATISEVRFPDKGVDVRVAMMFALDEAGAQLAELKGGERYYAYFHHQDSFAESPGFDWVAGFKALNNVVISSRADERPQKKPPVEDATGNAADQYQNSIKAADIAIAPTSKRENTWLLWSAIVLFVVAIVFLALKMRR